MMAILMVIQVFVAIALIGVVLIQRSEGGGLGIGSSQGMGAFMSGRGTANLLTRTTAVLAAIFLSLSLTMAVLNRGSSSAGSGILAQSPPTLPAAPAGGSVPTAPATPSAPPAAAPTAPTTTAPTTTAPAASAPATPAPSTPAPSTPAPASSAPPAPPAAPAAPAGPAVPH